MPDIDEGHEAILFSAHFIVIALEPNGILRANWKGFQTINTVMEGCNRMLDLMTTHRCSHILNDNTLVRGIWVSAASWLAGTWFPKMQASGMERFAWVYSPAKFSQYSTDGTMALMNSDDLNVRVFNTEIEARQWLTQTSGI